jgi:putative ABC transport system substrate-binding protein
MNRRKFLFGLTLGALPAPLTADAQAVGKVFRVGLIAISPVAGIMSDPTHPYNSGFRREMRDRGYVEGKNLILELRSLEGRLERASEVVAELVHLNVNVDVIVTAGPEMTRQAQRVTTTVPIVMFSRAPVEEGLVASLARPGGNITGLTNDTGPDLQGKRLELLREGVPKLRRVAYLGLKAEWEARGGMSARAAARTWALALFLAEPSPNDYTGAFDLIARERPDAIIISQDALHFPHRRLIAEFAARNKLPSMSSYREYVEAGGLMSYGHDSQDIYRRVAIYVDNILKGAKPADLPVEQPTTFELVINLKTAKALGLTIPQSLLLRADHVVQ